MKSTENKGRHIETVKRIWTNYLHTNWTKTNRCKSYGVVTSHVCDGVLLPLNANGSRTMCASELLPFTRTLKTMHASKHESSDVHQTLDSKAHATWSLSCPRYPRCTVCYSSLLLRRQGLAHGLRGRVFWRTLFLPHPLVCMLSKCAENSQSSLRQNADGNCIFEILATDTAITNSQLHIVIATKCLSVIVKKLTIRIDYSAAY